MSEHQACPKCESSDAFYPYDTGGYCFSCGYKESVHGSGTMNKPMDTGKPTHKDMIPQDATTVERIQDRKITEETCKKFNYRTGYQCQVANFYQEGKIIFQKFRSTPKKGFKVLGNFKPIFFGQHLWNTGKMLVITEGELDCLSVSQVNGNKWPVVSLPGGANAAKAVFKAQHEWLDGFDKIVLMFDNDEPGLKAVSEVTDLVTPGKLYIASLPLKDASEMLIAGQGAGIKDAMWNAKPYRPDGIIAGDEIWNAIINRPTGEAVLYPWDGLNELTCGMRKGEIVTWIAGTGVGKTQGLREIIYKLLVDGEKVGILSLEESPDKTALGIMSIEANEPLHLEEHDADYLRPLFDSTVGRSNCFLYDHFGSLDPDVLLAKIRFMVKANGCDWIILDHLSIVVSGLEGNDERRMIDNIMTKMRSFVEETNIGMHIVSHLKRTENDRGHEEGGRVRLSHIRGSQAIGQLSDMVIAYERNKQAKGMAANRTKVRVLKNRFNGLEGIACELLYSQTTGRLGEALKGSLTPELEADF